MQTIVQEPGPVKDVIRGLGNCGKIFQNQCRYNIRTCVIIKCTDADLLPQISSGDLTVVQLTLMLATGMHWDVIVGSAYMPYN